LRRGWSLPFRAYFPSTADSRQLFNYAVIFILAIFGGMLGTLLMILYDASLIVKEHGDPSLF